MGIFRYDIYKSPNLGLFTKTNDRLIILPHGFAKTKAAKLMEYLQIDEKTYTSIANTRLIGVMTVLNNNGILVPGITSDEEVQSLREASGLNVERLRSKFTAIGNLISSNDNGALTSPLFKGEVDRQVQDVLGVPVHGMMVGGYVQTGSMVVTTNNGAVVHPKATEEEIKIISEVLHVEVEPVTVNSGIPFLSSGIVANSKSVIVGSLTSGPELIMISRAFKA